MLRTRSVLREAGGAQHGLPAQPPLLLADGVERLVGRRADRLAAPLRAFPPLDGIRTGARIPDPGVALARQRDELPAAWREADFLEDADAGTEFQGPAFGVESLAIADTQTLP